MHSPKDAKARIGRTYPGHNHSDFQDCAATLKRYHGWGLPPVQLCCILFFMEPMEWNGINVNVQYSGGFLPGIILLTQCHYHRGTHLNAMKRFGLCSL